MGGARLRRLALALAVCGAGLVTRLPDARAGVAVKLRVKPRPRPPRDLGNFWRNVVTPHEAELDRILHMARGALTTADGALYGDYDPTGEERARFYAQIERMLRHARRLAPDNVEVLRMLGYAADELGHTRRAIDALQAAIDVAGPERAGVEVTGRLGAIYLRLGQLDDAIRFLRLAQGPLITGRPVSAQALVHLSNALARRGQTAEAIDVLANRLPLTSAYYTNEVALVAFALAVQYDRDEQRGAAFDVLDRMQTILQGQLGTQVLNALATFRFAPAEDQHYYLGLLYEAIGSYGEARAEWALYAEGTNLPYRARALDHIAAIDALSRAPAPTSRRRFHVMPPPNPMGSRP